MKILYHHRIASKDGQYVHIEELTNALRELGHEIIMVGPKVVEQDDFGSNGGLVFFLKKYVPGAIYELMEFSYSFLAFIKLIMAAIKHKPDCIYERYNLYLPSGVWAKKLLRLPLLLEVNAPLFQERKKYDGIALPLLARWTENYTWRNADRLLPVTQVLAKTVEEQAGVPQEKMSVIPNGINLHRFGQLPDRVEKKRELGLTDVVVLGFTGFVRDWHGMEGVVDLLAGHRERFLLIVGDGPARKSIEDRARDLNVSDQIMITGVVQREKVADYVSVFDVALQPDVVPYASPLKLFEYLALGRAVIAPDTDNIREVLRHEDNALLFPVDNKATFYRSIERLCDNETLRERLSVAARKTIFEDGYTWLNNAKTVESLFKDRIQS